jgi:hypothetical protein
MDDPPAENSWRQFWRLGADALLLFSLFFFLVGGYLAFAHYWVLTRWTKTEATVLSGTMRESSFTAGSNGASFRMYFHQVTISYPVAGDTRQAELDSPSSRYPLDAAVWAARWSSGQRIAIFYKNSDPARVLLADNPAEATPWGALKWALCLFAPGLSIRLASRSGQGRR